MWGQALQELLCTRAARLPAISADGNTAVEGAYGDSTNAGAFWVFIRSGGVWIQQGSKLKGTGAQGLHPYQGGSVAISADGNTIVEGGYGDNTDYGAIWVFTRSGGVWTQQGPKLIGQATGVAGHISFYFCRWQYYYRRRVFR